MSGPISLADYNELSFIALVYGNQGVGKTVLACSSQSLRTFVIDVDKGVASAKCSDLVNNKLITVWQIKNYDDFLKALDYFVANQAYFDLLVVDTATELQRYLVYEICLKRKIETPDQRAWGVVLTQMEYVTRLCRDLKKHAIFLAHETSYTDEITKRMFIKPSFQGQYGTYYGKHFSIIMRYTLVERQQKQNDGTVQAVTDRWLMCQRDPFIDAKDRFSVFNKWEYPHLDTIIKKAMEKIAQSQ